MRQFLILSTAAFMLAACQASQEDKVSERMDKIVRFQVEDKSFAGSVLVAKGDRIVFSKAYGLANREWSIPNTPNTKFRLGSVTKQFTAAAILLLEEGGKLKTDDLVKTHWPEAPPAWNKVTIFHLLTHTSGMAPPDYEAWRLSDGPIEKTIALFRDKPLNFEPGSQHEYSNSGYLLLGYLIERISGQSYGTFLREKIFTPLGMKDTGTDSTPAIIANRAAGYSEGNDGIVNASYNIMTSSIGSGALYSTTEDLLRWTQGLFGGKLLSPASLRKMTTPFKNDYAFGVVVSRENGRDVIQHGGNIEGYNAYLTYAPDEKITIVALANLEGNAADVVVRRLGEVMHGETVLLPSERREIKVSEDSVTKFTGIYEFDPDTNLVITISNGKLIGVLGTEEPHELFAESSTRFFLRDVDVQVEFESDPGGAVTGVVAHQDGKEMGRARRLAERVEVKLPTEVLLRYAGTYEITPRVSVVLTVENGHLMAKPTFDPKQELYAEAEDRFFFKTFNAQVEFTRDKNGQTRGLILHKGGQDIHARIR